MKVDVANGLGAGDAFCAAFGYGLLRGRSLVEAATFASVAGAIVASRTACSAAMPYEAELEAAVRNSGALAPLECSS
jgi:5-dehydro-2-deoxygluconokinase